MLVLSWMGKVFEIQNQLNTLLRSTTINKHYKFQKPSHTSQKIICGSGTFVGHKQLVLVRISGVAPVAAYPFSLVLFVSQPASLETQKSFAHKHTHVCKNRIDYSSNIKENASTENKCETSTCEIVEL